LTCDFWAKNAKNNWKGKKESRQLLKLDFAGATRLVDEHKRVCGSKAPPQGEPWAIWNFVTVGQKAEDVREHIWAVSKVLQIRL
jgi:hypothetical protein